MSEIPYFFETPVPKYFREKRWFDDESTFKFVTWAFSRCSTRPHVIVMDKKEVTLAPFEFVAGRLSSPQECYLTEKKFRVQLKSMIDAGLLKKGSNSRANRFTTYIWVTERFSKYEVQQKGQQRANRGPTEGHNQDIKNIRSKKDHHPLPSSSVPTITARISPSRDDDLVIDDDDLFQKPKRKPAKPSMPKIAVVPGVMLTQAELDDCIAARGNRETVVLVIQQVLNWPKRESEIYDWPTTIKTWKLKNQLRAVVEDNETLSKRLEESYSKTKLGWSLRIYHDRNKDVKGVLFEAKSGQEAPIFHAFNDHDFKEKVAQTIKEKRMQLSRNSKT